MSFNTRIQLKNDTSTNWAKATTFKPLAGEILVYDAGTATPKLKVGDGSTLATSLPFIGNDKVDKVSGKGLSTNDFTAAYKSKLDGIASGANAYTHPSYTAKSSGLYKVTVDSTGHISATAAVAKSDITGLGIPAQDTTYSAATTSAAGLMSAADKSKLDGIASGANNYTYTLPTASSSTLGGVKVGSNISLSSGTISLTKANVTSALGYTPPTTNTTYSAATTSAAGLMSAADKSKLDGITASADSVSFSQTQTSGTAVGTLTINGTSTTLYAPAGTANALTSSSVIDGGSW